MLLEEFDEEVEVGEETEEDETGGLSDSSVDFSKSSIGSSLT